jgi:ketol-acid reductoisomerase
MSPTILWEGDIDGVPLRGRRVGILGYGNQGRAQALCLRDSKVAVRVGLRSGSASRARAAADGLEAGSLAEVARWADVVMVLVPDEHQRAVATAAELDRDDAGSKAIGFAHGFNVTYGQVVLPPAAAVFLVAPCAPGERMREAYERGAGVFAYGAEHQDPDGRTRELALAYARALGCGRAGVLLTTFRAETEVDLFGEQAVLCGGMHALLTAAFETLIEAGYSPEMAYLECHHQLTWLARTVHEEGIAGTRRRISSTALYGDLTRGPRVVGEPSREALRAVLAEIRSGSFAREFLAEMADGAARMRAERERLDAHPMEQVGQRLRAIAAGGAAGETGGAAAGETEGLPVEGGGAGPRTSGLAGPGRRG